jgi:hypothetical protein
MSTKEDFEIVWKRIVMHQGEKFIKKLGDEFTYKICEDDFIPSIPKKVPKTSNKLNIQKAYMQWPVKGPSCFSKDIFATSYVWGVLNDSRIIKE